MQPAPVLIAIRQLSSQPPVRGPCEWEVIHKKRIPRCRWNPKTPRFVYLSNMEQRYGWLWVEARVVETMEEWNRCALPSLPSSVRYSPKEQRIHEKAYDEGLRAVQREARRVPRTSSERLAVKGRIVGIFPRFASVALGLQAER